MTTTVLSAMVVGVDAVPLTLEVHGKPLKSDWARRIQILGPFDPEHSGVKEAKARLQCALSMLGEGTKGFEYTIEMAFPTGLLSGSLKNLSWPTSADLAALLGIMRESPVAPFMPGYPGVWVGEIDLNGCVRGMRGHITIANMMMQGRFFYFKDTPLVMNTQFAQQAADWVALLDSPIEIHGLDHVTDLFGGRLDKALKGAPGTAFARPSPYEELSLDDIKGMNDIKVQVIRAVQMPKKPNILLLGSFGTGKTMLATRLRSLLPSPHVLELVEINSIYSAAGMISPDRGLVGTVPFRAPHHTASNVGLAGGGVPARPGELSLAHRGILFLDDLLEFRSSALDLIQSAVKEKRVWVSQFPFHVSMPADFWLIGASSPCPCGFLNSSIRRCTCSYAAIERYRQRLDALVENGTFGLVIEIDNPYQG